jgi:hypothetical protein
MPAWTTCRPRFFITDPPSGHTSSNYATFLHIYRLFGSQGIYGVYDLVTQAAHHLMYVVFPASFAQLFHDASNEPINQSGLGGQIHFDGIYSVLGTLFVPETGWSGRNDKET